MLDLRQSPEYAKHLELLGWKVEKIDDCYVFIRQFPLIGSFIKIQRPERISSVKGILNLVKRHRVFQISIEPKKKLRNYEIKKLSDLGFKPSSPSLPSRTLHIDLTRSEDQIFASFSSSKRRDIRRAIRDNVIVKESEDIESLIKMKNIQNGISGRILKIDRQFRALWQAFRPKKAALFLAYYGTRHPELLPAGRQGVSGSRGIPDQVRNDILLAGVLLVFHDQVAYYYQAASNKQGNKLAAPSLLVWEALKISKKKGCKTFDFEGIYDPRFPQKSWLGFTKFKRGFGGKEVEYPVPLVRRSYFSLSKARA